MSHVIVDKSRPARRRPQRLVIAGRVEGQLAEKGAVLAEDADLFVGHQNVDTQPDVGSAHADVVETAEVAQGDPAALVDAVVADPEVGLGAG